LFFLRCFGGLLGCILVIVGCVVMFTSSLTPRVFVNALYQAIFGIMILIAEFHLIFALKLFRFLTHYIGLGLFYVFVGGLALGNEWYETILAVLFFFVGLIYGVLGCKCKKVVDDPAFNDPPDPHRKNVKQQLLPSDEYTHTGYSDSSHSLAHAPAPSSFPVSSVSSSALLHASSHVNDPFDHNPFAVPSASSSSASSHPNNKGNTSVGVYDTAPFFATVVSNTHVEVNISNTPPNNNNTTEVYDETRNPFDESNPFAQK